MQKKYTVFVENWKDVKVPGNYASNYEETTEYLMFMEELNSYSTEQEAEDYITARLMNKELEYQRNHYIIPTYVPS